MNILIACERSQIVAKAFRERGHNVYSCDTEPSYGGQPQYHIIADILTVINGGRFVTEAGKRVYVKKWDMMIAHPPCTYLSYAGIWAFNPKLKNAAHRNNAKLQALEFFYRLYNAPIKMIAIENPRSIAARIIKPSQVIQPWMFGHNTSKHTGLWLKNLPLLKSLITDKRVGLHRDVFTEADDCHGPHRRYKGFVDTVRDPKKRSETFEGIARAMATQWT